MTQVTRETIQDARTHTHAHTDACTQNITHANEAVTRTEAASMMCTCVHTRTSHKQRNSVTIRLHELKQGVERERETDKQTTIVYLILLHRERERDMQTYLNDIKFKIFATHFNFFSSSLSQLSESIGF